MYSVTELPKTRGLRPPGVYDVADRNFGQLSRDPSWGKATSLDARRDPGPRFTRGCQGIRANHEARGDPGSKVPGRRAPEDRESQIRQRERRLVSGTAPTGGPAEGVPIPAEWATGSGGGAIESREGM